MKHNLTPKILDSCAQPPSGGCVLKLFPSRPAFSQHRPAAFGRLCVETCTGLCRPRSRFQPPSGGCVLKLAGINESEESENQPPSGGCVLKLMRRAAFRCRYGQPPSGGCVLKHVRAGIGRHGRIQPPSGGCVLKQSSFQRTAHLGASRLRAAVC